MYFLSIVQRETSSRPIGSLGTLLIGKLWTKGVIYCQKFIALVSEVTAEGLN